VPRSELFLTTKTFSKGSSAYDSILRSLSAAQLEYWDLVLIHAPDGGPKARRETWEALSRLVKEGRVKSLGVSNYGEKHLEELVQSRPEVLPVVNQVSARRRGEKRSGWQRDPVR
jgi:diketogulonate reductase-like aldo/keto reductase